MTNFRLINILGIIMLLSATILFSCTKEVELSSLVERNYLVYEINSDEPFSGKAVGQNSEAYYSDGRLHGLKKIWHGNGQLRFEGNYIDGKIVSSPTRWLSDGTSAEMTDIDGNVYKTVKIGSQVWMAENLKVTHYRDGTAITRVTGNAEWDLETEAYCRYNDTYGVLYNWYAVDDIRNIAPEGWHVSTDEEWSELIDYLGGDNIAGSKLAGNADLWNDGGLENDSEFGTTGFTALPGGYRWNGNGNYAAMGLFDPFWSATLLSSGTAMKWRLHYNGSAINHSGNNERGGCLFVL